MIKTPSRDLTDVISKKYLVKDKMTGTRNPGKKRPFGGLVRQPDNPCSVLPRPRRRQGFAHATPLKYNSATDQLGQEHDSVQRGTATVSATKEGRLTRRQFIAYAAASGAALAGLRALSRAGRGVQLRKPAASQLRKGLAIVHGSVPSIQQEQALVKKMTRAAVDALGGMQKLVRRGDRVIIKPNIAWVRPPEMAANTNPSVVAAVAQMCLAAGAGKVLVMDRTIAPNPRPSYEASGIQQAAAAAGAEVAYVDESRFLDIPIPEGFVLESWPFYEDIVSARRCDVLINLPVLKDHGTSRLTIGMKNVFGMVGGERGKLHRQIHHKIADLNRVVRVDLTILDAYRVLRTNGPTGGRLEDVDNSPDGARRIVAGTDPVAVDSYGAYMFGYEPQEIGFVKYGHEAGLGEADWRPLVLHEGSV